jgi:hypothetical protein
MSRATDASLKRMAAAERGEEIEEIDTPEPKKKHPTKKAKSLTIKLQEISAYEYNPSMRYLLMIIHLGTRREKDNYDNTWAPTGWTAEEMVGWCDFAQWKIAGRLGLTTDHTGRMLRQAEEDGWVDIEQWRDPDTRKWHARYRLIPEMVEANQRPEWSPKMKRGDRYAEGSRKGKTNAGSFSKSNQPKISDKQRAIREEDGE